MPRVTCRYCDRDVAAQPAARMPGKGWIYRHDEPQMHESYAEVRVLVSCSGSLELVELPCPARQTELVIAELGDEGPVWLAPDDGSDDHQDGGALF